jgi:hypothetical protein
VRTKRISRQSFLTEDIVAQTYAVYRKGELSSYEIAAQLWERLGYKDATNCANALFKAWKSRGWTLRSRSAARKIALSRRYGKRTEEQQRRERYERRYGPHQEQCGYPVARRNGEPCLLPRVRGARACQYHGGGSPSGRAKCAASSSHKEQCGLFAETDSAYCRFHKEQ